MVVGSGRFLHRAEGLVYLLARESGLLQGLQKLDDSGRFLLYKATCEATDFRIVIFPAFLLVGSNPGRVTFFRAKYLERKPNNHKDLEQSLLQVFFCGKLDQ